MSSATILHLCHGCDAEKLADAYCPSCEEVTPVYEYDGSSEAFARQDALIHGLVAQSRTHDAACLAAVEALPELRVGLAA